MGPVTGSLVGLRATRVAHAGAMGPGTAWIDTDRGTIVAVERGARGARSARGGRGGGSGGAAHGLAPRPGQVEPGAPADLVVLDPSLDVVATIVAGRAVFDPGALFALCPGAR